METTKKKIMIVDDDPRLLYSTKELLEMEGYEVITIEGSLGTMKSIIKNRPDLILLDINMPILSGERIADLLSNDFWKDSTRILFHSSNDEDSLRSMVKKYGVSGYICKGNIMELRKKVAQNIN